jgi:hypothetical protein
MEGDPNILSFRDSSISIRNSLLLRLCNNNKAMQWYLRRRGRRRRILLFPRRVRKE